MEKILHFITILLVVILVEGCTIFTENLLRIQENGLYGYINFQGKVKIQPQYKYAGRFSKDGYALIISDAWIGNDILTMRYGFINTKNELVVDTVNYLQLSISDLNSFWEFNDVESFVDKFNSASFGFLDNYFGQLSISQGVYQYMDENKKIGYKDLEGNVIIPACFRYAGPFFNDVAIVSEDVGFDIKKSVSDNLNTFSLIDIEGYYIKEKAWFLIQQFSKEGLTWCCEMDIDEEDNPSLVWTQIDLTGEITIGPVNSIGGFAYIYNGYTDNSGLYIYQFPKMLDMHIGYSFINKDGLFATDYNGDGNIEVLSENPEVFADVTNFSEGYAGVKVFVDGDARWKYMTPDFEFATAKLYDSVKPFTNNLAVVQQMNASIKHGGCWGAINKDFELVIPYKFSELSSFSNGVAYARISGSKYDREGWINKKGEFIWVTKRAKNKSL